MQKFTSFLVFSICFVVVNSSLKAQQNYSWVKSIGGTSQDLTTDMVASAEPYLYVCGTFTSASMQLGNQTLTNSGGSDIFVAKYDLEGNVIWAKKFGGSPNDDVVAIARDDFDNIYITGKCNGSASFGSINFTGNNFIAKINSNGEVIRVIEPVSANVKIRDIGADSSGNMVICGDFSSTGIIGGTYLVTYAGYTDGFVAKFNTTGTLMWVKQIYGTSLDGSGYNEDFCNAVAVAPNGRIGVCGSTKVARKLVVTTGTAIDSVFITSFSPVSPSFPYYFGFFGFVMQWDANGNLLWIKDNVAPYGNDGREATSALSIATNANGELFVGSESMSTSRMTIPDTRSYVRMIKYSNTGVRVWFKDIASSYTLNVAPWLATNARVAVYGTKAYISYRLSTPFQIVCINDLNNNSSPIEWTSVYTGSSVDINAITAKGYVYAVGRWISSFGVNVTPVNYGGSYDGFIAKLNGPTFLPLTFSQRTPDKTVCLNSSISLATSVNITGGTQPYTYTWSPANTLNYSTTLNPLATPTSTTNYILTVTDAVGERLKDTVTVTVLPPGAPPPTITPNSPLTVCNGDTVILSSSPAATYLWNNGATTQSIKVTQAGSYSLSVGNDAMGCRSLAAAPVTISLYPRPAVPIITQSGNTLSSTATTGNLWYLNGIPISDGTDQTFIYNTAGTYIVTVTNSYGCSTSSAPYNAPVMITNPNGNDSLFSFSQRIAPNPVMQQATIRYELNSPSTVSVYIVNNQREPIATLVNQQRQKAGTYTYPINQNDKVLRKGNYYVVYVINGKRRVEPIMVL